ncbi:hypothetical protein AW942_20830 [Pseudomonas aeruginosa]|nr:hypothetical protein YQ19_07785 [Pseudomonas aeruginosa]EWH30123.1 hypothetical protein Z695_0120610 [Pseudomonas aeruginosa SG17M]OFO82360.1 hypothetical protein HMPREF3014_28635 [Pseudomonas sp. HMSC065H01]OFR03753.1 hypothetical protein HMPREF2906_31260 [Pseudomonas sp. HMSC065H02]KXF37716.1 hypothetical protein AW941_21550 [Pseudomonas aeruginosa]
MHPAARVLLHIQDRVSVKTIQTFGQSVAINAELRSSIKQRREIENRLRLITFDHMMKAVGCWSACDEGRRMTVSPFTQLVVVSVLIEHRIDLGGQFGIDDGV